MPQLKMIGNDVTVALPVQALTELGLKVGDEVTVSRRGGLLEIVPTDPRQRLRPSIREARDQTIEQYGPALKRLAACESQPEP